jgi:hypothetical protein
MTEACRKQQQAWAQSMGEAAGLVLALGAA